MELLAKDPSAHVRAMAIEVVGRFVHGNRHAAAAIEAAVQSDPSSAVRKKAGWYAPGALSMDAPLRDSLEEPLPHQAEMAERSPCCKSVSRCA